MKSPDEIKKGLLHCDKNGENPDCRWCPLTHEEGCMDILVRDALAYIEQLESNQHGWRSPKSEPPDVDTFFAVSKFDPEIRVYKKNLVDQHYTTEWLNIRNEILWWMPVPDVPKEV